MSTAQKILKLPALLKLVESWKKQHETIVFTNGCFDLIHLGHIDYLEKSRATGDKLIVGLNSDKSVKNIKGKQRPIIDEKARARMLAAFEFVDAVVLFDEDTPFNLISAIIPDVLIKGKDYEISNIIGADIVMQNGGNVITVDLVEGYSTTKIIDKVKQLK